MRNKTLILTLATAAIISLGWGTTTSTTAEQKTVIRGGQINWNGPTPQPVTIVFGVVPVSLAGDTFEIPIDLSVLAH